MAKMELPFFGLEQMDEVYTVEHDMLFERLLRKLNAQRHLLIVAERSWGLKDYVNELGFQLVEKNPDIQICRIDVKPAHTSESFLVLFERALINRFPEASFKIQRDEGQQDPLKWPGKIASQMKIKVAVFLANTHLLYRYKDRILFLRQVKLKLRNQKNCIFCLYGYNTQHLLNLVQPPGPLSGLGQLILLNHDPTRHRSASIRKLFHTHDKNIGYTASVHMSYLVENHPFYLKLLAWHALHRTRKTCTPEVIDQAMNDLIHHFDYHFLKIEESLTTKQIGFLKALLEGNKKLCSRATLEKYHLGTSSHVARIMTSLVNKEIVNRGNRYTDFNETSFRDPLFREWFKRRYGADG